MWQLQCNFGLIATHSLTILSVAAPAPAPIWLTLLESEDPLSNPDDAGGQHERSNYDHDRRRKLFSKAQRVLCFFEFDGNL